MKNLTIKEGPAAVEQKLRMTVIELKAVEDEGTPETAALGEELDGVRQALQAEVEVCELAIILAMIWTRRVLRRDTKVDKATARLVKSLHDHSDEPAVAAVIPLAIPTSASEATRGLADEKQGRFVRNLIAQVKGAAGMPGKVVQRLAELEAAQAKLEAGLVERQAARDAAHAAQTKLDGVAASAREAYNGMYFRVGSLFLQDKARVEAFFG